MERSNVAKLNESELTRLAAETGNRFASEVYRGSGASATTSAPTGLVS